MTLYVWGGEDYSFLTKQQQSIVMPWPRVMPKAHEPWNVHEGDFDLENGVALKCLLESESIKWERLQ